MAKKHGKIVAPLISDITGGTITLSDGRKLKHTELAKLLHELSNLDLLAKLRPKIGNHELNMEADALYETSAIVGSFAR